MTLAHSKALLSRLSGQLIGQRFAKLGASARRVLLQCQCTLPPVLEFGYGDNFANHPVPIRPINWPLSSIDRPLISSNIQPYGLIRKWCSDPGTRAEMWVKILCRRGGQGDTVSV